MKSKNTKTSLHALCESAIMVALAAVFSLLRFPPFRIDLWGNGGSIDFVMIPIVILGYRRGIKWAIPAGLALGLTECLIGSGIGYGLPSVLLDYVLAFGAVGLAGLFKGKKYGLVSGAVVASIARFVFHFVSGLTIWKLTCDTNLFGLAFGEGTFALYSLVYNGSYMLGNMIIAVLVALVLTKPVEKIHK